jgi:hypothetical protein
MRGERWGTEGRLQRVRKDRLVQEPIAGETLATLWRSEEGRRQSRCFVF